MGTVHIAPAFILNISYIRLILINILYCLNNYFLPTLNAFFPG